MLSINETKKAKYCFQESNPLPDSRIPRFPNSRVPGIPRFQDSRLLGAQGWPSGDLEGKRCSPIAWLVGIFDKTTVSPARDKRDIDFVLYFTGFVEPRSGPRPPSGGSTNLRELI